MRRAAAIIVGALLVLSMGGSVAQAQKPQHEVYENRWVNVFWNSKIRVDSDTSLRITWYAGAYIDAESGFFSDLYRSVERCTRTDGRVACRYVRHLSWYGYTRREAGNSFTLDQKLSSAHLEATYRLYRYARGDSVLVGRFRVDTDVTGTGKLTRGRNSYSSHQGCTTVRSSGKWESRQATATGTLAEGTGPAADLGETDDANFGASQSLEIDHTC